MGMGVVAGVDGVIVVIRRLEKGLRWMVVMLLTGCGVVTAPSPSSLAAGVVGASSSSLVARGVVTLLLLLRAGCWAECQRRHCH